MSAWLGAALMVCLTAGGADAATISAPVLGGAGPLPAAVAMAWGSVMRDAFARLDTAGLAPGLAGPLSTLRRTDFSDPVQVDVLEPLVYSLAGQSADPAAFSRLSPASQAELLASAFSQASLAVGAQAARLVMAQAGQDVSEEDLAATLERTEELLRRSVYLMPGQQAALQRLRDGVAAELDAGRQRRVLELAAETARRLSDDRAAAFEAPDVMPFDPGEWTVVRAVATPEGRKAWFVHRGSLYRLYFAGDGRPAVEFDVRDWDQDGIPAFTVERDGRRGVYFDGRVLWES